MGTNKLTFEQLQDITTSAFLTCDTLATLQEYVLPLLEDSPLLMQHFELQSITMAYNHTQEVSHTILQFKQTTPDIRDCYAQLTKEAIFQRDDSQPAPAYSYYFGSLYIDLIGEA